MCACVCVFKSAVLFRFPLLGPPITVENKSLRDSETTRKTPRGRHDEISWGRTLYRYRSGPAMEAARAYDDLARRFGMSLTELSLRWSRERRAVTTTLVGHTSMAQLKESLLHFRNDQFLPDELMWEIDRVHMRNRLPIFSSNRVGADWYGEGMYVSHL